MPSPTSPRHVEVADVLFALFLATYGVVCFSAIPFDFRDICYLFSLEQGRWVMQEWVHPIYVPTLDLLRGALRLLGYQGRMLGPVEMLNVAAAVAVYALLYRLARRFPGAALAAVLSLSATALSPGFWQAAIRPTPYALALLTQTIALLLLVSDMPVPAHRYALAGALAGVTMGFHASAMAFAPVAVVCALLEPDPARTRQATLLRILAFGSAMVTAVFLCWAVFVLYRSIGASFFENQDFASMFAGIEQVPGTSIYTSRSVLTQITTFVGTIRYQGGLVLVPGIVLCTFAFVRRWRSGPALTPLERRLAIAAGANFAGIAGFFLINNTHNGFIFASLTLLPVVLAVAVRDSRIMLALLALLTLPEAARNLADIHRQGDKDPLLAEVRFLQRTLGSRDVLLTPGTPFPEMMYLAHFNAFEVTLDKPSHWSPEVPVVRAGPELHARIAWWLAHGARVFYALGDDSSDFRDDVSGAEKMRQIFWRSETMARERAPEMAKLRVALEASGLELRDGMTSPGSQRYAEIHLREAPSTDVPMPPAFLSIEELQRIFLADHSDFAAAYRVHRAQYLADLEAAIPGDPWRPCDIMELVCQGLPRLNDAPIWCRRLPGCDAGSGRSMHPAGPSEHSDDTPQRESCFWAPLTNKNVVEDYLADWVEKHGLGRLADWGFHADRQEGEMNLVVSGGSLTVRWHLADSCGAEAVHGRGAGTITADRFSPEQLQELVAALPLPTVRAASRANQPTEGH